MHLGRDDPEEFWAPYVSQVAPGLLPRDMWQIEIGIYVGMAKAVRKNR